MYLYIRLIFQPPLMEASTVGKFTSALKTPFCNLHLL